MKHLYKYILLAVAMACGMQVMKAQTYNGTTWYSLYNTTSYNKSTAVGIDINEYSIFSPTNGSITLDTYMTVYQVGSSRGTKPNGYTLSANGATISVSKSEAQGAVTESVSGRIIKTYSYTYSWITGKQATGVAEDLDKLTVHYDYNVNNTLRKVYIRNVKVPMAKHIRLIGGTYGTTSVTKDFGEVYWGQTSSAQTVNFRSFLTSGNITVKLTSGNKNIWRLGTSDNTSGQITKSKDGYTYAVGSNKFAYDGSGACNASNASVKGKASGYDFVVYFCPTEAVAYSGTITITDGVCTATVTLSGTGKKRNQTIQDFSTSAATIYTDADISYSAYTTDDLTSAANSLPVTYSTNNESVAKVVNGKLTIYKDGTVTITAKQTGNAYYNPTEKSITYIIKKYDQTIQNFSTTAATIYTDADISYDAYTTKDLTSERNNLPVTYSSNNESVAKVVDGKLVILSDGTVTITASQVGNLYYYSTSKSITYTIKKYNQTIQNFPTTAATIYTDANISYDAYTTKDLTSERNNLPVTYSSNNESVAKVVDGKLVILSDGTVTITASQVGNLYYYSTSKSITYTIKKYTQIIKNFSNETHNTTDEITLAAYTVNSLTNEPNGLPIEYYSLNQDVATVDKNTGKITILKDGTLNLYAKQAGNQYYYQTTERVVFTIKKVTPTLNVAIQSGLTYEPGVKVQDRFQTTTAVNDKGANVEGTFSCTDELQAYNGTAHSYTVTFTPTNTNWYNTATCEAVATVARAPQEIVWTMEDDTECVTGTVLGAYATSGLAVAYTVSDPSVATVDNTTGELIVSTINQEIDVTVCQDGDLNWLPAECITKTLQTVGARPDDLSDVTATDITYEQTLNSSQLSGVVRLGSQEIEGTLSWVHPSTMPNVGDAMHEARFTPDELNVYSPVTFLVNVHVNKAQSVITSNITNPLTENTTYTHPYSSNNIEAPLTVTVTVGTGYASFANDKLTLAEVHPSGQYVTLTLTVEQAATSNYIGATKEFTYKVYKKSTVCLPIAPLDDETYAHSILSSEKSFWSETDEAGKSEDYSVKFKLFDNYDLEIPTNVNVRYDQYKGIRLGTFEDGLTGWKVLVRQIIINAIDDFKVKIWGVTVRVGHLWLEWLKIRYNVNIEVKDPEWSDKYVELSYTGVPDSLYFGVEVPAVSTTAHIHFTFNYDQKEYTFDREILPVDFPATLKTWKVEVFKNNSWQEIDKWSVKTRDNEASSCQKAYALDSTVRRIRIHYTGNFAGFVRNLTITRKHYLEAEHMPMTLTFGTSSPLHPLQEPQQVKVKYSSIAGSEDDYCPLENQPGYIVVTSSNPDAFYADIDTIRQNTHFDMTGNYDVKIRCTDVKSSGDIVFTSSDGLVYRLPVSSEDITITAANPATDMFQTGTEHSYEDDTPYMGLTTHDLSGCFNGSGEALYDTLYIFGVTGNVGNDNGAHAFTNDKQHLPLVNTPNAAVACNAHTPCFVYYRDGSTYRHSHTVQAAADMLGNLAGDDGKKLYMTGYCPFANTGKGANGQGFVCLTSEADIYLNNFSAYSRNHTANGSSTPEPVDETFYLGNNYIGNGLGSVITWTNPTARIHLRGENTLQASYGKQIGQATATSLGIDIDMSALNGYCIPAAALTFLPSSPDDAWSLNIDNEWIDGSITTGTLSLKGSDGAGSIDTGTEHATITIAKDVLGNDIVDMNEVDTKSGIKKVGCRIFMSETKGQGVSVYGVGDYYEPSASAWTAALPGRSGAKSVVARNSQNRILYAALDEVNVTSGESYGEVDNTSSYAASKRQTLLLNAPADKWRTFVAPFDITDVFVLEARAESDMNGKTIAEGKTIQADANKQLLAYLAAEMPAEEEALKADKSVVILISNWLAEKRDANKDAGGDEWTGDKSSYATRGLYELEHYDPDFYAPGKDNLWTASWYLYEIDLDGTDEEQWILSEGDGDSKFNSKWKAVHRADDGVLMHKGKTYAWQLPYCAVCPGNTTWDYWSGKIIVFEGYGSQTLDGTSEAEDGMSEALTAANDDTFAGFFAGNTALRPVTLPADAFVHDTDPESQTYDYFVAKSEGEEIDALTPAIFTKIAAPKGMKVSAIARTGKIVFAPEQTGVTTDLFPTYESTFSAADNLLVAYTANGISVTLKDQQTINGTVNLTVYAADGKKVCTEPISAGQTVNLNLNTGLYLLSASDGSTAKVTVR